jgi:hypothetical protein
MGMQFYLQETDLSWIFIQSGIQGAEPLFALPFVNSAAWKVDLTRMYFSGKERQITF